MFSLPFVAYFIDSLVFLPLVAHFVEVLSSPYQRGEENYVVTVVLTLVFKKIPPGLRVRQSLNIRKMLHVKF